MAQNANVFTRGGVRNESSDIWLSLQSLILLGLTHSALYSSINVGGSGSMVLPHPTKPAASGFFSFSSKTTFQTVLLIMQTEENTR